MKKKSASRSAFFNLRVLIGLFVVLAGVFLALAGIGTFSAIAASSARAQKKPQQKHKIINIAGLPPGFDCATIHEKGIDRMEGFRAGLIMIACGESKGGSASPGNALVRLVQKLLPVPLAYGAADVDLVTGTETAPNIIQSETYTTANPDNPDEICVAFNDSRGAAVNQLLRRIVLHRRRIDLHPRHQRQRSQALLPIHLATRLFCITSRPRLGLRSGWMGTEAARWAGTSRPRLRIQIAGPISAFTPTAATTGNLAGPTITPPLLTSGTCTFPGMTLMLVSGALEVTLLH